MNSTNITRTVFAGVFLLCIPAILPGVFGQQPQLSNDELIAAAREIISTARFCALITQGTHGRAHARTMDPFPPDDHLVIWFGTNPKSRKVAEIRRHRVVTLYYFDRDSPEKAKHWKDDWKAFYPDREKGYLLIAVTPQVLEVVNEKKGIVGDAELWTPPTVRFSTGGRQPRRRPHPKRESLR